MKKTWLMLGLLLICLKLSAQEVGEIYCIALPLEVQQCNSDGSIKAGPIKKTTDIDDKVEIRNVTDKGVVVRFLDFRNADDTTNPNHAKQKDLVVDGSGGFIWFISTSDLEVYTNQYYRNLDFQFGTVITPLKVRLGQKKVNINGTSARRYPDIQADVNLGAAVGLKFRPQHSSDNGISLLGGVSATSITVGPESTFNAVTEEDVELLGLSYHVSLVGEIDKVFIALTYGQDFLPGQIGANWIYNQAPWIGLGIGYTLFQRGVPKATQK